MRRNGAFDFVVAVSIAAIVWATLTISTASACGTLTREGTEAGFPRWIARNTCGYAIWASVCFVGSNCSADVMRDGASSKFLDLKNTGIEAEGWYCPLRAWQEGKCHTPIKRLEISITPPARPPSPTQGCPSQCWWDYLEKRCVAGIDGSLPCNR